MNNIGVDAGCLSVNKLQQTGVYNLTYGFLKCLSKIISEDKVTLYTFGDIKKNLLTSLGKNFQIKKVSPKRFWISLVMTKELLLKPPNVFIGFGQALPLASRTKKILIVYDLAFELFPESYPNCKKLSIQTKRSVKSADIIIVISEATRKDLINIYGTNKNKIKVIYPGCDEIFRPKGKKEINRIRVKYKIKLPYILYVGSYKPLKNIPRIVKAFIDSNLVSHNLVLAGGNVNHLRETRKTIRENNQIMNLGYVPKDDLPGLYSGAEIFISPSIYEGFGIPILEALSCGTPVITSKTSSMPEVVEKAGITVNPENVKEITSAIKKITSDKYTHFELKEKGLRRSKAFSNMKFAKNILAVAYSLSK